MADEGVRWREGNDSLASLLERTAGRGQAVFDFAGLQDEGLTVTAALVDEGDFWSTGVVGKVDSADSCFSESS